jgi:hypothetical protein
LFVFFHNNSHFTLRLSCYTDFISLIFLDANQVLLVVTDGQSHGSVDQPAQQLKDIGLTIFAIGVGSGIRVSELETMATSPVDEHVYLLDNFEELSFLADKISSSTCNGMKDSINLSLRALVRQ